MCSISREISGRLFNGRVRRKTENRPYRYGEQTARNGVEEKYGILKAMIHRDESRFVERPAETVHFLHAFTAVLFVQKFRSFKL